MADENPISNTLDVRIDGELYVFRKPSIRYPIEVGYRAADVRRRAFPPSGGALPGDFGLDYDAVSFARACAVMELYLVRSDQEWPFSAGSDGKPMVDFDRFPPERDDTVRRIGAGFEAELARFRTRRAPDEPSAAAQAVAGQ